MTDTTTSGAMPSGAAGEAVAGEVRVGEAVLQRVTGVRPEDYVLIPKVDPIYYFAPYAGDVALDIRFGKKVMLTGHTGTGKTSLFHQLAALLGVPVIRQNMNGQTTVGDFVGLWTVQGGQTVWVDGALTMAMRYGWWVVVDEIDFAEAQILSVLNSVLEKDGILMLKEKGHEIVHPHPNFRLLSTANTAGCMQRYRSLYQGTNILNEAFLDRWRVYHVDYLPAKNEAEVVAGYICSTPITRKLTEEDLKARPVRAMHVAAILVKIAGLTREAFEKEEVTCTFSLRRVLDWAEMCTRHSHPLRAAEATIFSKISKEDSDVVKSIIQRVTKLTAPGEATDTTSGATAKVK